MESGIKNQELRIKNEEGPSPASPPGALQDCAPHFRHGPGDPIRFLILDSPFSIPHYPLARLIHDYWKTLDSLFGGRELPKPNSQIPTAFPSPLPSGERSQSPRRGILLGVWIWEFIGSWGLGVWDFHELSRLIRFRMKEPLQGLDRRAGQHVERAGAPAR